MSKQIHVTYWKQVRELYEIPDDVEIEDLTSVADVDSVSLGGCLQEEFLGDDGNAPDIEEV